MKILNLTQRTKEWKDFRSKHIGASDSPTICGINPYSNPGKLWNQKMMGDEPFETESMKWGVEAEPIVRKALGAAHNCTYLPLVGQHEELEWMFASFDGVERDSNKIIEIKCVNQTIFALIKDTGKVPPHFVYQVNHQMIVADAPQCLIAIWNGSDLLEINIEKDEKICKEVLEKGKAFYDSMMFWTPPEESHEERLDLLYLFEECQRLRDQVKDVSEKYEAAINTLKLSAGLNSVRCGDHRLTKYLRRGTVNYKVIPELKGVNLDNYRGSPSTCWRVS